MHRSGRIGTQLQGTLPCSALCRPLLAVRRSKGTRGRHPFRSAAARPKMRSICSSPVLLDLWVGDLPLLHWCHTLPSSQQQEPAARLQQMALFRNSLLKRNAALPQLLKLPGRLA